MQTRLSLSGEQPDIGLPGLWATFEGVGMIRSEFLLRDTGLYWTEPDAQNLVAQYVRDIAEFFAPRPVWYRASDLWTDEANPLKSVDEIWQEDNPIIGCRGTRRALALPNSFEAEIRIVAGVASDHPNLHLLTPFVGDADEFSQAVEIAGRAGWRNRVGSMLEIPSAVLDAKRFVEKGATNLMLGLNDLTSLLTGTARSGGFDLKMSHGVWWCIEYVRNSVGSSCEWGIAGSLSKELLARAAAEKVPYVSLHYSELPQLLDVNSSDLHHAEMVRNIKRKTRERGAAFRQTV